MSQSTLTKALEFYDMGFNPTRKMDTIESFVEDCERKMYIVEQVNSSPSEYFGSRFGVDADVELLDSETDHAARQLFFDRFGMYAPHPIVTAERDFKELTYIFYSKGNKRLDISYYIRSLSPRSIGTVLKVKDNGTSITFPILRRTDIGSNIEKDAMSACHELFHSVSDGIRPSYMSFNRLIEEEYIAYDLQADYSSTRLGPLIFSAGLSKVVGTLWLAPLSVLTAADIITRNYSSILHNTLMRLAIFGIFPLYLYTVTSMTEQVRRESEELSLNPYYILGKVSAFDMTGHGNIRDIIRQKAERRAGLRWELLDARLSSAESFYRQDVI